jgi:antitoxin (DNA-binding transcriptional repressor) of toxin-antitoxin stability system
MRTVSLEEAQAHLPELIAQLQAGESVLITREEHPVAQLVPVAAEKPQPRFGNCMGMLTIIAEDDEHLEDFREYLP